MNRKLINWLGLLGPISFLSYILAMVISPIEYLNYDWMSQAVSDLSAQDSPARMLWQQTATLYNIGGIVSITLVCVYIEDRLTGYLRRGIYLFGLMNWISAIGYSMFPLTSSGNAGAFQDMVHIYVITPIVIILSIISLVLIIYAGFKDKTFRNLGRWALLALLMMFAGAIGVGIVPAEYFGIPERFSVLAATGFNAVLGIYLLNGFYN
ncbi:DUF998 domain-containing protein [Aerococcaceae bacterium DSM 111176]|nr:DUF998 domain-containing protein [Aerococcaceae bacterium DSM 111176]